MNVLTFPLLIVPPKIKTDNHDEENVVHMNCYDGVDRMIDSLEERHQIFDRINIINL